MTKWLNSIESVVADVRKGRMVIVVDDADRENEGDLIMAGEWATPQAVNFMARYGRGLICVPTTSERLKQLGIEQMVVKNRESFRTDFQVSVDAAGGVTTGISAADRARTIKVKPTRPPCRTTSCSPATSSRCAPSPAASSSAPATPRPSWTSSPSPAAGPSASCAKS